MTIQKIKDYLDSMKCDDPVLFDECLEEIMASCVFWNYKIEKAGRTIITELTNEKEKC